MGTQRETLTSKQQRKDALDNFIEKKTSEYVSLRQRSLRAGGELGLEGGVHLKERQHELALAYNERGQIHYRLIEFDEAVEDYTHALKYDDHLAAAYYNRGTVHYRMGCFDIALKDMENAVSLDPGNVEFLKGLEETKKLL